MSTSSRQSSRVTIVTTIVAALLLAMPLLAAAQATGTIDNAPQEMSAETGEDPTPPTATATHAVITPTATTAPSPTATAAVETPTPTTTPSPTATATATQDVMTPTATASPLPNTDTITTKAETTVSLQPGEERELPFSYQVTTPRTGTTIHAELRTTAGDPATGWVLRGQAGSGGWIGDGASADLTESSATTPGSAFTVTFAITAPAAVKEEQTVSLFVSSTATTDAGEIEAGIANDDPILSLSAVPAEGMMIGPMMVTEEEGYLNCEGPEGPRTGPIVTYTCSHTPSVLAALVNSASIDATALNASDGWEVELKCCNASTNPAANGPGTNAHLSGSSLLDLLGLLSSTTITFEVIVHMPGNTVPSEPASTKVDVQTCTLVLCRTGSVTLVTTPNQAIDQTDNALLECIAQDGYTIAIGSDAAFTCSFKALSTGGLGLNSISLGTLPLGWTASMSGISHGGTFDPDTNIFSFPEQPHLAANQSATFDLTLDTSCEAASASIVLTPDSSATMEPTLELPLTIDTSSAVVAASFTGTDPISFGDADVTGIDGDTVLGKATLDIGRPVCADGSIAISIESDNGTIFDPSNGESGAIPLVNVSVSSSTVKTGDDGFISALTPEGAILEPATVAKIIPATGDSTYTVDLGLSLDVPAGTEPGTYTATLVVDLINDGEQP